LEDEDLIEVVFRVDGDTVSMVEVKTGIQDADYIEITDGLKVGETIVTGPYNVISKRLEQGDLITIKDDDDKKRKN